MIYLQNHESVTLPIPPGYTPLYHSDGSTIYKHAADKDGFIWVPVDGSWKLYVPWFDHDENALVEHVETGTTPKAVTKSGAIKLTSTRTINNTNWIH